MAQMLLLFETYNQLICDSAQTLQADKNLSAADLRANIQQQLTNARQICAESYSTESLQQAEFAVCAYLDSYILSKNWPCAETWRKNLLQDDYFNTTDAGVLFYEKCEALTAQQPDLLHLYFSCLAAGFRGQYHAQNMRTKRQQVMERLLVKLHKLDPPQRTIAKRQWGLKLHLQKIDQGLLIEASDASPINPKSSKKKLYALIVTPMLLFLAAYGYFYWIITHSVQSYLQAAT